MNINDFLAKIKNGINIGNGLECKIIDILGKLREVREYNVTDDNGFHPCKIQILYGSETAPKDASGIFYSYESMWGNSAITKELIRFYKTLGFDSIRLPITMGYHYDRHTDTFEKYWLNHIREIVDWIIEEGMVCSIVLSGEIDTAYKTELWTHNPLGNPNMKRIIRIWEELANLFKDVSEESLCFEVINEFRLDTYEDVERNGPNQRNMDIMNAVFHELINVIRNTGGNNANRAIGISGYQSDPYYNQEFSNIYIKTYDDLVFLTLTCYDPVAFTMCNENWGITEWGSEEQYNSFDNNINQLFGFYIKNQIPFIISEYGTPMYNDIERLVNNDIDKSYNYRLSCVKVIESVKRYLSKTGVPAFLWDNGYFVDRENLVAPSLLMRILVDNVYTYRT